MNLPLRLDGATLDASGPGVAVTPHYLATDAAIAVLAGGGNAVDAAIAANATLGVVAPETCGIGGDLFALVHTPGDAAPTALNASGRAGQGAMAAALRDQGMAEIPIDSSFAVTVPGCVDGWAALSSRYGSMPLAAVLTPAINHARDGFAASPELSHALLRYAAALQPQQAADGLYPNGEAPQVGAEVHRPQLAETMAGIGRHGRTFFYTGDVADAIIAATDGTLAASDLQRNQAEWVNPISLEVMGWTGWTIPPNSQGYLMLAAAWLFERLNPPRDPQHPDYVHAAVEAYRAVAWERDDMVADPTHSPRVDLLDTARLEARLAQVSPTRRTDWPVSRPAPGGTAYLAVRDSDGMGVSLIQSNFHGIGSRIGAGNAGFLLHDRGSGFTLQPGHPNELAPGKRPLHTLAPTLWTEGDQLRMLLGTRGGDFQPQTLLQMLSHTRWAGLNGRQAHLQPRWATLEWRENDHSVAVEPHLDAGTVDQLRSRGHEVRSTGQWMAGWGPVSIITIDGENAVGAADPRVAATAARST
ncbi:MAG: gamma-glutamyltransferase [Acidimicrobiia bacterium]|nr:gamma-glutamyltransferase [Acidimicrobiia bacterium]